MIKHILIAGLVVCLMCGLGSAGTWIYTGGGSSSYCGTGCSVIEADTWNLPYVADTYKIYASISANFDNIGCTYCNGTHPSSGSVAHASVGGVDTDAVIYSNTGGGSASSSATITKTSEGEFGIGVYYASITGKCCPGSCSGTVVISNETAYTVSGTSACVAETVLYLYSSGSYHYLNSSSSDSYSFDICDGLSYRISFDGKNYDFTCDDNKNYNYDACIHTIYRLEESCGNLIPDSEGLYIENYGLFGDAIVDFYASDGILDISNTSADFMYVYTDTFIGKTGWIIDPVVDGTTYTLENPNIAWSLKVIVVNDSDGELIDGAMIKVNQDCYCTSGYSTRQKMTANGMVDYGDMSLEDASLMVMATGYKILNENSTGYSAFLSGRTNFSSKTWIVKMAPTWSNNTSTFYEPEYKVDIHFKNEDGNRTSQILDTDTEVYLYYENNNSEEEAMTLKFQSSSTHSYFIDEDSWTIAYDDIGHKTIPNPDFTPWTYAYRAIIYNSSVYGWNLTIPLTVRNETKEETIHYENLTTNLWFRHESDGKIDYREDMQIVSHARSNNTTLMTIDLEVWKDGSLLCYTNLTETDYENADFPYYYVYEPVYDYVAGSNYTVKMYGFDRTLLEVRYLEVINDTITRKNKLTIGVKDRFGNNLNNCYIYLEGWGSLSTGSTYYNAYEGISNGDYRYKAAKTGYTDSGWSDVTLTDGDQIVWYTLSQDVGNVSVSAQKFTDEDIKGFFFPLMYFLLICIIFGGLKYVTQ